MLRVDDVNLVQGVLNICHSKGPSQRYVVLHDTMLDLLARYRSAKASSSFQNSCT